GGRASPHHGTHMGRDERGRAQGGVRMSAALFLSLALLSAPRYAAGGRVIYNVSGLTGRTQKASPRRSHMETQAALARLEAAYRAHANAVAEWEKLEVERRRLVELLAVANNTINAACYQIQEAQDAYQNALKAEALAR